MTVRAFTGGAGCGKTYQLMQALRAHLEEAPLAEGQKVLALTFMHGSRRRLEERIAEIPGLKSRAVCTTIDSFSWGLVRRWRSLAAALDHVRVDPGQYELVCNAAADLLGVSEVQGWVNATFPVLLIDEAQDLTSNRLRVVQGLAVLGRVLVAADEFQCLNEDLRPNPACDWLEQAGDSLNLVQPRRTEIQELLDAATAIRNGTPPQSGNLFKVQLASRPALAGTWASNNLNWFGGGRRVAIITPVLREFAQACVNWVAVNRTNQGAGPYTIEWEKSEARSTEDFIASMALEDSNDVPSLGASLVAAADPRIARAVTDWMDVQRRAQGKVTFSRHEVVRVIEQAFSQRRRQSHGEGRRWSGMTVHGAKNREFDSVIVLWPAAVVGSDEQKRRLLYNAVTRARSRCLVLVQAAAQMRRAPFA